MKSWKWYRILQGGIWYKINVKRYLKSDTIFAYPMFSIRYTKNSILFPNEEIADIEDYSDSNIIDRIILLIKTIKNG